MKKTKWQLLQLFAEEADTGVQAADPGQQRLLELGVPARILEKRAENGGTALPEQVAAATGTEENPRRMSWEEIMADPEYNRQMQAVVRSRLKEAKASQAALETLTPGLKALAREHDLDPENPDYAALSAAMEKKAQLDAGRDRLREHFQSLERQAQALRSRFPDFDLGQELQNPAFVRMTAPGTGIGVEDAYFALHREHLQSAAMELAARKTAQMISNDIQAARRRPDENGLSSQASSVNVFDYRNASPRQRAALKKRILEESAQGRKVYPGT